MLDVRDRPHFTEDQVIRIARQVYGLEVQAKPLPSERDQNFLLGRDDRPYWVLKIANSREKRGVLEFQNEALRWIQERDPSLNIPRQLPSIAGEYISEIRGASNAAYMARLVTYVDGVPLANMAPHASQLLSEIGDFIGRLDKALRGFSHPSAKRSLSWSVMQAREVLSENLDFLTNSEHRSVVEMFLAHFVQSTWPILGELRSGVIHNDANDHNVLVHRDVSGTQRIAGLLDFGDLIHGPLVHELAVASAYVMQSADDPMRAASAVVRGYHASYPLTAQEIDVLFDLITIRLCTTVVLAAKQSAADPGRDYLTVSEKGAWRTLGILSELKRSSAAAVFRDACSVSAVSLETSDTRRELLRRRQSSIGPSLSVSYRKPLHIVRGYGQYLFSASGRAYLDCVNNVAHVGHCHPKVVAAGQRQMTILNTNTRYLHDDLLRYAERLSATLPEPLSVCYFVCTGSEANELAIRMARTYTGRKDMIVLEGAYHGNTSTLIDHSPYKHGGPGGAGAPEHVHTAPMPDPYRGRFTGANAGQRYAEALEKLVEEVQKRRGGVAGFICEPLLGCGGQLVPPAGYLPAAFESVRQAGGVCITDEVQVGFGRVGTHFWAFETQDIVPDIVTLGKPIGNGHPLAAVVTTPEIAAAFDNGMEYFNTFGGNPVSCAIGLAVLEVIEEEGLQQRASTVGKALMEGLTRLMDRHELIGDVRGKGLFIGVELVNDRQTKRPAAGRAEFLVEEMRARGILLSTDGPDHNVIKIKPPLVISEADAAFIVHEMDQVLASA